MKLKDCVLDIAAVISTPLLRKTPDDSWLSVYKSKSIPESLYKFYVAADYFSFDKCPKFLKDDQKILFPHLETSIELIKSSFEEYHGLIELMKKYDSDSYTPVKKAKGEKFDPVAPKYFNRCFQVLIINMYSILDSIAEAIAIILSWGNLGKSEFSHLVEDSKKEIRVSNGSIVSVDQKYIEEIKGIIREGIIIEGDAKDWYDLFKLYRNKLAHFRRYSGFLLHDKEGNFYHFLPRQWPYYFQQDMSYVKDVKAKDDVKEPFSELLIEQDIFEYCAGLYKQIYTIMDRTFNLLTEAFKIKKDSGCGIDPRLQKKVISLTRRYKFKQF